MLIPYDIITLNYHVQSSENFFYKEYTNSNPLPNTIMIYALKDIFISHVAQAFLLINIFN